MQKSKGYIENRLRFLKAVLQEQIGVRELRRRIEEARGEETEKTEENISIENSDDQQQAEPTSETGIGPVQVDANGIMVTDAPLPPSHRRDYLRQNLRPAVSLVAQAVRHIEADKITEIQRKNLRIEIDLLRRHIEVLEAHLKG